MFFNNVFWFYSMLGGWSTWQWAFFSIPHHFSGLLTLLRPQDLYLYSIMFFDFIQYWVDGYLAMGIFFIPHSFSGLSTLLRPLHQYEKFQIDAIPPSVQVKCITWNSNFESCLLFMYYVWNAFFECMTSHYVSVCILYEINVLVSLHNFSFSVDVKNRYQACVVHGELIKWKMWPLCSAHRDAFCKFPFHLIYHSGKFVTYFAPTVHCVTTMAVINPPERKLAKRISVQCLKIFLQIHESYRLLVFLFRYIEFIHSRNYTNSWLIFRI